MNVKRIFGRFAISTRTLLGTISSHKVQLSIGEEHYYTYGNIEGVETNRVAKDLEGKKEEQEKKVTALTDKVQKTSEKISNRSGFLSAIAKPRYFSKGLLLGYRLSRARNRLEQTEKNISILEDLKSSDHYVKFHLVRNRKGEEKLLPGIDQDFIADSPVLTARKSVRGRRQILFMFVLGELLQLSLILALFSFMTNPRVSNQQLTLYITIMVYSAVFIISLIAVIWYVLGFIEVHDVKLAPITRGTGNNVYMLLNPDRYPLESYLQRMKDMPATVAKDLKAAVNGLDLILLTQERLVNDQQSYEISRLKKIIKRSALNREDSAPFGVPSWSPGPQKRTSGRLVGGLIVLVVAFGVLALLGL